MRTQPTICKRLAFLKARMTRMNQPEEREIRREISGKIDMLEWVLQNDEEKK